MSMNALVTSAFVMSLRSTNCGTCTVQYSTVQYKIVYDYQSAVAVAIFVVVVVFVFTPNCPRQSLEWEPWIRANLRPPI
jgi:predicted metal-binding protein